MCLWAGNNSVKVEGIFVSIFNSSKQNDPSMTAFTLKQISNYLACNCRTVEVNSNQNN
jgi:hypothetical protein